MQQGCDDVFRSRQGRCLRVDARIVEVEPHCREWLWARVVEFVGVALNYACHSRRRNREGEGGEKENGVADQPRQSRADAASVLVMHVGSHSGVGCCGISRELCYF